MSSTPSTREATASDGRLAGKVAVVSGAARGIGAATAGLFAREGASVVLGDVRVEQCHATAAAIGPRALAVRLDVTDARSWARTCDACERSFGAPSILVNNAGIQPVARLADTTEAVLRETLDVNLIGVFLGIQAVIPRMAAAGGGSIVNLSSVAGFKATTGFSAYTASKWGVRGLTKAAAVELGTAGIRVNSIHPGGIDTDMIRVPQIAEILPPRVRDTAARAIPRLGTPAEIARLALFLASDESTFCTGAEFVADGGTLAGA